MKGEAHYATALTGEAQKRIEEIKGADILVGIPSYNNAGKKILSPENFTFLEGLARKVPGDFELPPEVWCRIVYDFAVYYHRGIESGDKVVDYMTPLYFGRTGSFVLQSQDLSTAGAEKLIMEQAETFEQHKPYLIERWNQFITR